MSMTLSAFQFRTVCVAAAVLGLESAVSLPLAAQPLTIPTVVVGDPGNPADPLKSGWVPGIGTVEYPYHIGKYEVTNAQYAAFLNAVAATDTFNLYNTNMGSDSHGGITRSGGPGSYTYEVKLGYADMPVVFVSFWDAARFCNWLATGYTEGRVSPSSPLLPGAAYDTNFVALPSFSAGNRLPGAAVFLPSENEWYKAAYYQPASAGGPSDSYWLFATRSDTRPTSRMPAAASNSANYYDDDNIANGVNGGYAVTQSPSLVSSQNYLTDVGAYGPASESYYGTADQNGNVWEWTDTAIEAILGGGPYRVVQGGSWASFWNDLQSSSRTGNSPLLDFNYHGFRVASLAAIPEPRALGAIAGLAALAGVLACRRGRGTL